MGVHDVWIVRQVTTLYLNLKRAPPKLLTHREMDLQNDEDPLHGFK